MIISILIPTTSDREYFFSDIMSELCRQVKLLSDKTGDDHWKYIEILKDPRGKEFTIGKKRNDLLFAATGEYVQFIDSDDMVCSDFFETELKALESKPDCLSLRGIMTTNGLNEEIFEHSLRYPEWRTVLSDNIKHERYPNHLNCIKASIAKQFKFPEKNFGEDHAYSKAVHESGLIKKEVYIEKILYHYKYRTNK